VNICCVALPMTPHSNLEKALLLQEQEGRQGQGQYFRPCLLCRGTLFGLKLDRMVRLGLCVERRVGCDRRLRKVRVLVPGCAQHA
jgi:hypothetical protein